MQSNETSNFKQMLGLWQAIEATGADSCQFWTNTRHVRGVQGRVYNQSDGAPPEVWRWQHPTYVEPIAIANDELTAINEPIAVANDELTTINEQASTFEENKP